ncbi:MAG: hypothetical protein M3P18_22390 [Actinomycetota bacterium]|nr:hypothetical protein [Actinomycetota bacterium]
MRPCRHPRTRKTAHRLPGLLVDLTISQRVLAPLEDLVDADPVADLELKGFSHAVPAFAATSLRSAAA